jgi:transposase
MNKPIITLHGKPIGLGKRIETERQIKKRTAAEIQMDDVVSLEQAYETFNRRERAAASTVEALIYVLRSGVAALADSKTKARLAQLDEKQLREVAERVQRFKQEIAPVWTAEEVDKLLAAWGDTNVDR